MFIWGRSCDRKLKLKAHETKIYVGSHSRHKIIPYVLCVIYALIRYKMSSVLMGLPVPPFIFQGVVVVYRINTESVT